MFLWREDSQESLESFDASEVEARPKHWLDGRRIMKPIS